MVIQKVRLNGKIDEFEKNIGLDSLRYLVLHRFDNHVVALFRFQTGRDSYRHDCSFWRQ